MPKMFPHTAWLAAIAMLCLAGRTGAVIVTGGSASITFNEGVANSIAEFDSYFDATRTRAQTLSDASPGNAAFTEMPNDLTAGVVQLVDPIRPSGVAPLNDAGGTTPGAPGSSRTRQATTLDVDPTSAVSLLGSWSLSSEDFGAFAGATTLGEQIAFTSMQRWTGPFPGALLYGDMALRYTGSRLVLTTNIDFLNAVFAEIGSPVVSVSGSTLTISGDLLIGGGLALLDSSAIPGTDFGDFSMTANLAAVPEAGAFACVLAATAASAVIGVRRMRRSRAAMA